MRIPEELEELRQICPEAKEMQEGSFVFVLLPALRISGQGQVDSLLCPQARDGYMTRLFLSRQIAGKGANWTNHQILDRGWWSWSWQNVGADQRLIQILAAHLAVLQ